MENRSRRTPVIKTEPVSDSEDPPSDAGPPKPAVSSPAQEATRAHILGLEMQVRRLRARTDDKEDLQIRCLEEELRKAHSKLKRLLNEAERQRRRRERIRGRGGAPCARAPSAAPQGSPRAPLSREDSVMSALQTCTRFQDFVRELNALGFTITQREDDAQGNDETMPEVDGVKVQVELIEGDEELSTDFKGEISAQQDTVPSSGGSRSGGEDGDPDLCWSSKEESYRRWFERQTELQQRWEEGFMREQMELARGLLETVTSTFLQGVQQVLTSVTGGRRFPPHHFCPEQHPT